MMRYRLRLHRPLAVRTIIAESRWTHSGRAKPLYAASNLTAADILAYNVRVVDVQYTSLVDAQYTSTAALMREAQHNTHVSRRVESMHRAFLFGVIRDELTALRQSAAVHTHGSHIVPAAHAHAHHSVHTFH